MRSDRQLSPRFTGSRKWTFDRGTGGEVRNVIRNPDGSENVWTAFSHSGKERNRLFLNQRGRTFVNVSAISGADGILDGRSFVLTDFNRDGRTDFALVNSNGRLLQFFENQLTTSNGMVAFRLRGSAGRQEGGSNRDAIGTRVVVQVAGKSIMRILSCGEGFANVNGRTLRVGIGAARQVEKAIVYWPSGMVTEVGEMSRGELVTIDEIEGVQNRQEYLRK